MKNIFATISLVTFLTIGANAQVTYLPTTGGTLTGNLVINSGSQLQAPYYGLNAGNTQPANSGNVAIFTNNSSTTLDFVGWGAGWRFVPNSNTSYPAPVVTIDQTGSIKTSSSLSIFSNQFGQQIQMRDATGSSTIWWMGISDAAGDNFSVGDGTTNSNRFIIQKGTGYVGLGTTSPVAKLDVSGPISINGNAANLDPAISNPFPLSSLQSSGRLLVGWNRSGGNAETDFINYRPAGTTTGGFSFFDYSNTGILTNLVSISASTGTMLIGQPTVGNPASVGYLLDVKGFIRANKLVVNTNGADFVFEPGYKLTPLNKVEEFIKTKHYLPGIVPAAQMQKDGVDVGYIQTKLLQKVEELTLYIIELKKQAEKQQIEIEELKKKVN